MDKVKIYIPINTDERLLIRDEIAKSLSKKFDIVIIHSLNSFNQSVIEILIHDVTNDIEFFKYVGDLVSDRVGEPILFEITQQTKYMGVMGDD